MDISQEENKHVKFKNTHLNNTQDMLTIYPDSSQSSLENMCCSLSKAQALTTRPLHVQFAQFSALNENPCNLVNG